MQCINERPNEKTAARAEKTRGGAMTARSLATLLLSGLFVLCWSSGFIGAVYGLEHTGTFTLLFWRYLLFAAVMAALCTAFRAWRKLPAREVCAHALIGVLAHAVWLVAVLFAQDSGVSPGIASFLTALQPMVTAVFAARVLAEKLSPAQWGGIALGLFSVGVVIADKATLGGALGAHLLPLVAVVAVSAAVVLDRRMHLRSPPPVLLTTTIHAAASLLALAPLAWLAEDFAADFGAALVFSVAWLALVVSLGAYGLMFALLRRMQATMVSSLVYLTPPVTMVLGYLIFGDAVTAADFAGLGLAAIAVVLVMRQPRTAQSADRE